MTALFWPSYVLRSLRRSGRRGLFAVICITVGVAGVVALQTASLTIQAALTSNIRSANGGDISVVTPDAPLAGRDLRIFARLKRQGAITAWTAVSSFHATAVGPAHALVPFDINVVTVPPYPLGGQPTFVPSSNASVQGLLRRPGDVLITSVLADELGAHVGDRLLVNSIGGSGLRATVRGVLAETSFEHAAVMTVTQRDLASLASGPQRYVTVYANTEGNDNAVAAQLRQRFPLATVQTVQEALTSAQVQVHDFRQFILLVGLLALLIAGIGILNAMQSMLAWRRLEIAMLKAIGYPQIALYALFGGEAVLLGVIGGITGTALGAIGSKIISDALARALALQIAFQLDVGTLLGGVALGVFTTLIFAIMPIIRAAGFRPLELLREGSGAGVVRNAPPTIVLLALVLVLFAALAAAIMGDAVLAAQFIGGAFGAAAVLTLIFALLVTWMSRLGPPRSIVLGGSILIVLVLLAVLSVLKVPAIAALMVYAAILWGVTVLAPRRLLFSLLVAARSLGRRRTRTSVTLVAFLVGVLAMSLTLTVALSLQSQINAALAGNGAVNLVAVANSTGGERQTLQAARKLPGVKNRSVVIIDTTSPVAVNGKPIKDILGPNYRPSEDNPDSRATDALSGLTGLSLARGDQPAQIEVVAGRALGRADAGTNNVLVRSRLAGPPFDLRVGDTVTVRDTSSGVSRTVHIAGLYQRHRQRGFSSFFTGPVYGDRSLALALGAGGAQSVISFNIDPNYLTHDATTLQHSLSGVLVLDIGDLTRVVETILNELLNLLAVITALALGAGLAVVANGVALAMLERRREIALLKAIGFGPRQVLGFVLTENALAGTLAGAVSVLGVAAALGILSRVALSNAIGFDPRVATLVLIIATVLAMGAAYLAARGPIRVRPLEALRNE